MHEARGLVSSMVCAFLSLYLCLNWFVCLYGGVLLFHPMFGVCFLMKLGLEKKEIIWTWARHRNGLS